MKKLLNQVIDDFKKMTVKGKVGFTLILIPLLALSLLLLKGAIFFAIDATPLFIVLLLFVSFIVGLIIMDDIV